MNTSPDYFALFGLKPGFNIDSVALQNRYFSLSNEYNPNYSFTAAGGADSELLRMSLLIDEAYNTLSDSKALLRYILQQNGFAMPGKVYEMPDDMAKDIMELDDAVELSEEIRTGEFRDMALGKMADFSYVRASDASILMERYNDGDYSKEVFVGLEAHYFRMQYMQQTEERLNY